MLKTKIFSNLMPSICLLLRKIAGSLFNRDYRFTQRLFPGFAVFGVLCAIVVPVMDKLSGMKNSYLLSLPTGIMCACLWFFPRKGRLSFYHKFHWEMMCLYSFSFVGIWLAMMDPRPASVAINFQMPALFCGFFSKPFIFFPFSPLVTFLTFQIYVWVNGADGTMLMYMLFYPFLTGMLHGSVAALVRAVMEHYYNKLLDTELKLVKLEAEKKMNELRISVLRAKSDPHFLFNTLNSICHIARDNPAATESAILSLSRIFRYILTSGEQKTVGLQEELVITKSYLELQRLRFGDKLNYNVKTAGDIGRVQIPALSLQSVVENSIKHGFNPRGGSGRVDIEIDCKDKAAVIAVKDDGIGFKEDCVLYGHGLTILEERLKCLWKENSSVRIESHAGVGTIVEIKVPLEEEVI